jgi:hypothetical protein
MPNQTHACINHGCSHICLLSANRSYKCACPENMDMLPDKHTCHPSGKNYNIILGVGRHIVSIPQKTFGRHETSFADDTEMNVDRMAYNSINGELFFVDNKAKKIMTADMRRKNVFDLVSDHIFYVSSMAYGELKYS